MKKSTSRVQAAKQAHHQQFRAWIILALTVGSVVLVYLAMSLSASDDPLLMPLDDTYIHFQYARQFAQGEPMVYNPGDPATSGGTSLLYPPLLAVGYVLGFANWSLAYWALAVGIASFFASAWLVYLIAQNSPLDDEAKPRHSYALALALAFALSGPFVWAALSGMETTLFVLSVLLTLYAYQRNQFRTIIAASVLMTVIRPEGNLLAGLVILLLIARRAVPADWPRGLQRIGWYLSPFFAAMIQPIINLAATGSTTSSGMQAKSHLYNTGAPVFERISDVFEFWIRLWRELLVGGSPDFGVYTSSLLSEVALAGLLIGTWWAWRKRRLNPAVLILAWIIVLSAAVATLDPAFWQFKRYQLPIMALFFPAAAWTAAALGDLIEQRMKLRWPRWIVPTLILLPSFFTTITFARNYLENVTVVRDQQVLMAHWVRDNLPDNVRIGVHDVGLVRYFGNRALYDVVGLTTPGPSEAWRQGPGAIYETMAHSEYRPAYFAIYPDVQGLGYLLNAGVFGEVLAEFPVGLPPHNVASATPYQAVYRADWSTTHAEEQIAQQTTLDYVEGMELVDAVDVANLDSEANHDYKWWFGDATPGFVTEVSNHLTLACGLEGEDCRATDGGRILTGGEEFTLHTISGEDLLLVTRVHGRTSVPLKIYVNDRLVAQRVQPAVPGFWTEIVSFIPADQVGPTTRVRIEPDIVDPAADAYIPYYHWAYQGEFEPTQSSETPLATFDPSVQLLDHDVALADHQLRVDLTWQGAAPETGDGIVFIHLYNDIHVKPVAQLDQRPMGGVLPPGNWLPGILHDSYTLDLSNVPPGTYTVAIGLYDARSKTRYAVSGSPFDPEAGVGADQDRLFIGKITIEE